MQERAVAAAAVTVAALVASLVLAPSTARAATTGADTLAVDPPAAVAGGTVTVSGSCAGVGDGVQSAYPTSTDVRMGGVLVADDVPLRSGRLQGIAVPVPAELEPREHELTSTCGLPEPVAVIPFTVLRAPLLTVTPESVEPGEDITVTGTCVVRSQEPVEEPVEILLSGDGRPIGTAALNGATGVLEPLTVPVPVDADPREDVVVSSCGGEDALTIRAPDPPTEQTVPPTGGTTAPTGPTTAPTDRTIRPTDDRADLIAVPNLFDLTEEEARLAVGDDLVLDVVIGTEGRVTRQEPQPGELVTRGSTVGVDLGPPPLPDGSWSEVLAAAVLVLAVAAAAIAASARILRRHHQRRWLDRHVETIPAGGSWATAPGPDGVGSGVDMRIQVRRDPPGLELQEVGHARD